MPAKRFWAELKSSEFAALDPNSTLAVLPVAATEQHGPHLPVMTDTAIAEGMIKTVLARLPDDREHVHVAMPFRSHHLLRLDALERRDVREILLRPHSHVDTSLFCRSQEFRNDVLETGFVR